jgi:hypothetical protein
MRFAGVLEQAGLEWLAGREAVHWLAPTSAATLRNMRAVHIVQSAVAEGAGTAPLWAAGLHGEGQVVGMGDSGVDTDSCYFRDDTGECRHPWRVRESRHLESKDPRH